MLEADSTFVKVSSISEEIPKYKVFTLTSYVLYQELELSSLSHTRQYYDHCNNSYSFKSCTTVVNITVNSHNLSSGSFQIIQEERQLE